MGLRPPSTLTTVWTFQTEVQLQALLRDGLLQGHWSYVYPENEAAYRLMCREMAVRGLSCEGRPPVWGWHSCGGYQRAPDAELARQLLSDHQLIETPMVLLTFECPGDQVLNSDYNAWCDQVYFPLFSNAAFNPLPEAVHGLFEIDYTALDDAPIQTVSPSLRREWLVEVRKVHLDAYREVCIAEPWWSMSSRTDT
ncbi:hypothetical protein GCM10009504_38560 [Pseudomonas laurentiana]|uniref:DUF3841 domain-containing protein n=1 Tax=Pseudomonas laurentiana TaxID=2364649 RepID=A0A6I5RR71_9PSED|nr:DUF3841 domain-containing protein [Pseudomonas laurentiana]NES10121.1 DUF3841 domain-containing protein [Pseudomonas laurentiana]GGU77810.1 hypothetical protein GCM10009504_38560 [Pseudomonas laurentiana]